MMSSGCNNIIFSRDINLNLLKVLDMVDYDSLFVLADENTYSYCLPLVKNNEKLKCAEYITIGASDTNKTLESVAMVWRYMGDKGGTRNSLLVNIGGVVTVLGGFAASTFKRGIRYINIPTTLLSMVDASVGGKTGINFNGLKNEIGEL